MQSKAKKPEAQSVENICEPNDSIDLMDDDPWGLQDEIDDSFFDVDLFELEDLPILRNQTEDGIQNAISEDKRKGDLVVISAYNGDDEFHATTSSFFPVANLIGTYKIGALPSQSDSVTSKVAINYSQERIYLPHTVINDPHTISKYASGKAFLGAADRPWFKDISIVRKASDLKAEMSSKLPNLTRKAGWTQDFSPTYSDNQMLLLIGLTVLDLKNCNSFPFFGRTEMGCGGLPPWGQINTAINAISCFNRGRSKKAILGMLHETVAIHENTLPLEQAQYRKLQNIVSSENRTVVDMVRGLAIEKDLEGFQRLLDEELESSIPKDLSKKRIEIDPQDIFMGTFLSGLRKKGEIYSEQDLIDKVREENRKEWFYSTTSFAENLEEEDIKWLTRAKYFRQLAAAFAGQFNVSIKDYVDTNRGRTFTAFLKYFGFLEKKTLDSFCFHGRIHVWKAEDVNNYFRRSTRLQKDLNLKSMISWDVDENETPIQVPQTELEMTEFESFQLWKNTGMDFLKLDKFPLGVGTEDCRIAMQVTKDEPANSILVTSDRKLQEYYQRFCFGRNLKYLTISSKEYLLWFTGRPPDDLEAGVRVYNPLKRDVDYLGFRPTENLKRWVGPGDHLITIYYDTRNLLSESFMREISTGWNGKRQLVDKKIHLLTKLKIDNYFQSYGRPLWQEREIPWIRKNLQQYWTKVPKAQNGMRDPRFD